MKLIRIIILIALVLSIMPLEAFCDDGHHHDHEAAEQSHCAVMCHCACHGAVIISAEPVVYLEHIIPIFSAQEFSYDEPFIPTEYRPPIFIS